MYTKNFVKQKSGNTDTLDMLVGKSFTNIVIIDFPRHYFLSEEKNLLIFYLYFCLPRYHVYNILFVCFLLC